MKYFRIIIISVFLLIWQMNLPVHSACEIVSHSENVEMTCCTGIENCNCCCSHDFETKTNSKCDECEIIEVNNYSKVFDFNKKSADFSILYVLSTVLNPWNKANRFDIILPDKIHIKEKPYLLISLLLI